MVNYKLINIVSTILSLTVYIFVIFLIFYIRHDDVKKLKNYGYDIKKSVIVNLDDIPKLKKINDIKKIKSAHKKQKVIKLSQNNEKKSKKDSRDIKQNSIKNLFSTMKVDKNANSIEEKLKQEKTRASRLKKLNAKELFKSDNLDNNLKKELLQIKSIIKDKSTVSKIKGEYDEKFLSKISSIITLKWNDTIATKNGLKATVIIKIDNHGHLFYRNLKSSFNNIFDSKLKHFLDNLTKETFPKYKKGKYIEVEFLFSDKEEL